MNRCYQCSAFTSDQSARWDGFGLCGKCRLDRKREYGADPIYPRNSKGLPMSSTSQAGQQHRESFRAYHLYGGARDRIATHHEYRYGFRPSYIDVYALAHAG